MTRKPKLTRKRERYVKERASGILVGSPLTYPAGQMERYEKAIGKLTRAMFKEYAKELASVFRQNEVLTIAQDASISSQARIMLNRLRRKFERVFAKNAPVIVENIIGGIDKASQASLGESLRKLSGGITLKTDAMPAALQQAVKASIAENVTLIKSIASQYHTQIEGAVMRSLQPGGRGMADVRDALDNYEGITDRRKNVIAKDQVRKVTAAIDVERSKSAGITKFKWLHSGNTSHAREDHVAMSGNIYDYDDPPVIDQRTGERGYPGQAINCHPATSNIEVAHGCVQLYRRAYSGELVSLVSENGVVLQATPNHPVLTLEGWKAAKDVNFGDYLVKGSHQGVNVSQADVHNSITAFDKFFDAAARLFGKGGAASASTAFEFHGDAADGEVDIVFVRNCLPAEVNSSALEQLRELVFAYADSAFNASAHGSAADECVVANLLSTDSRMSSFCSLLSELRSESARADVACGGLVAYIDTALSQDSSYSAARDSVFFGQLKLAHSEGVLCYDLFIRQLLAISSIGSLRDRMSSHADSLGEIVGMNAKLGSDGRKVPNTVEHLERVSDKFISEYTGHVYNLETDMNWYVVEGIISHNCRCQMIPILEWGDD